MNFQSVNLTPSWFFVDVEVGALFFFPTETVGKAELPDKLDAIRENGCSLITDNSIKQRMNK